MLPKPALGLLLRGEGHPQGLSKDEKRTTTWVAGALGLVARALCIPREQP